MLNQTKYIVFSLSIWLSFPLAHVYAAPAQVCKLCDAIEQDDQIEFDLLIDESLSWFGTNHMNAEDGHGDGPLHQAVRLEREHMTQELVDHGANLFHRNHDAKMPLQMAAEGNHTSILRIVSKAVSQALTKQREASEYRWSVFKVIAGSFVALGATTALLLNTP